MIQTTTRLFRSAGRLADEIETSKIIRQVRKRKLTYLDRPALCWLAKQVREVEKDGVPGRIVETGCALGGSSIVMASEKSPDRPQDVYDLFGQIPAPSAMDGADVHARYEAIASGKSTGINGNPYYGYEPDLLVKVIANFESLGLPPSQNNVRFIKGLYEETLFPDAPVAFAHIDCDWYDSVMVSLKRIVPLLSPGGKLVIDDYFHYSGCRAAVWDYFRPEIESYSFVYGPRLLITAAAEKL